MGNQDQAGLAAGEQISSQVHLGWARVFHETVLPLLITVITIGMFTRLDQAHEALFGTIGPAPHSLNGTPVSYDHYIGSQFFALVFAICLLGFGTWYSTRLLLTIDRARRHPLESMQPSRAVQAYPRLIGALTSAALILALIGAEFGPGNDHTIRRISALLAVLLPLGIAIYAAHRQKLDRPFLGLFGVWLATPWFGVIWSRPQFYSWTVVIALSILCYVPSLQYAFFKFRRPVLQRFGWPIQGVDDSAPFGGRGAAIRLGLLGSIGLSMLATLCFGSPAIARALGSSAIVLSAITAILFTLSALTLVLRRLAHNRPGFILIGATCIVGVYLVLHGLFGWTVFDEKLGEEMLAPVSSPSGFRNRQPSQSPDIVVNAFGGGLRAALFTAEVMADLDDHSCGEFGRRLKRLSGVSGGSLGIATYMVLRQEFVSSGGWVDCTPSTQNRRQLSMLVDDTLLQDHLSAPLARMLSTDLIPGVTPRRGQALLDSWQDALTSVLAVRARVPRLGAVSLAGLAMPLRELDGGVNPAPAVFFNATDVATGERVWFSNRGEFVNSDGTQTVADNFQVGQAVLHSARFPVVSPAGRFVSKASSISLVDGGYADNSGASTLLETDQSGAGRHWLNIDGNPPEKTCQESLTKPVKGFFSGADALFAVRESQARLAVRRFRQTGTPGILLKPDNDKAFEQTMKDAHDRCEFVQGLRSAPLGWYLTPVTIGNQDLARREAVRQACDTLKPLCGT